jgi:hypothetical protein
MKYYTRIIIIRNYRLELPSSTSASTRKGPQLDLKLPHYLPPPLHEIGLIGPYLSKYDESHQFHHDMTEKKIFFFFF